MISPRATRLQAMPPPALLGDFLFAPLTGRTLAIIFNVRKEGTMINLTWLAAYLEDVGREARTRLAPVLRGFKERYPQEKVEAAIVETVVLAAVMAVNTAALLVRFGDRIRNLGNEIPLD
jgi:hypothetical protein